MTTVLERAREVGIVAVDLEIDAGHARTASLYRPADGRVFRRPTMSMAGISRPTWTISSAN